MAGKEIDTPYPEGASDEYIAQWSTLKRCVSCGRPMRPPGTKASEWPSTVAYGTANKCKSDYNRDYLASKDVSAAATSVREVKGRRNGQIVSRHEVVLPRAQVAASWSEEERSAALQICDTILRAPVAVVGVVEEARAASEVIEMLGLFEAERTVPLGEGLTTFRTPLGSAEPRPGRPKRSAEKGKSV